MQAFESCRTADGNRQVGTPEQTIAAHRFAGFRVVHQEVFEVVGDLVGMAPGQGQAFELRDFFPAGAPGDGGQEQGEADQGDGFAVRHRQHLGFPARRTLEVQIVRLTVQNAVQAQAFVHQPRGTFAAPRTELAEHPPKQGITLVDERQRAEHGRGFPMPHVGAGKTAALTGIVHRRQVVEKQRGGVEIFDRHRQLARPLRLEPTTAGRRKNQLGPEEAAAMTQGVVDHPTQVVFERRPHRQQLTKTGRHVFEVGGGDQLNFSWHGAVPLRF